MVFLDRLRSGIRAIRRVKHKPGTREVQSETTSEQRSGIPAHVIPLVEEIDQASSQLIKDPTSTALMHYKEVVRNFLDMALADSMRVSSEASAGLSHRVFSTIARIDVQLAELADAVLGRQQDVLKIKSIVDQVKGLVVDLYR
jgi:uncharacterized protein YaaR (DUF327 family)